MLNLLLVDNKIPSLSTFVYGVNKNTKIVTYSLSDTFDSLKEKIYNLQVSNFDNLGFVFMDDGGKCLVKKFVSDSKFLSIDGINGIIQENNTTKFIKEIVLEYSIKKIDFLACNLLSYDEWKKYFDYLMKENQGLIVRASNDKTGNLSAGGDWILESSNEDVSNLYFNENIGNWNELLDTISVNLNLLKMEQTLYTSSNGINFSQVSGSSNNILSAAQNGDYIVKTDGTVWTRGSNTYGQLGVGDNTTRANYTQSKDSNNSFINDAIFIDAGPTFTVIVRSDGTLWVSGQGQYAGLGNGVTVNVFTQVSGISDVVGLSCGFQHTVIISGDAIWAVGYNEYGQLGISTSYVPWVYTFTQALGVSGSGFMTGIKQVSCGNYHTVVLNNSGYVYSCGYNYNGQLGVGSRGYGVNIYKRYTYSSMHGDTFTNGNVLGISCGSETTHILKNTKTLWSCGRGTVAYSTNNFLNQVGDYSSFTNSNVIAIKSSANYSAIIKSDLSVWTKYHWDSTSSNTFTYLLSNLTSAKQLEFPRKWYSTSGFQSINTNNRWAYFPDFTTTTITASEVTNNSTSFFYNYSDKNKIIKLEPAGTVFNDYISFIYSLNLSNTPIVYFKSDGDTTHVRLTQPTTQSEIDAITYGAYYQLNPWGDNASIRVYTKHFSEVGFGYGTFCLLKGTKVLTTEGYKLIETLTKNDLVVTDDNREVPIKMIFKTKINLDKNPDFIPYKIEKDSITLNYPSEDTYMSGYHLIKYNDNWIQPNKCSIFKIDTNIKEIIYYHIRLENFETDNLVVNNGLIVESLGNGSSKDGAIWEERSKNSLII